MKKLILCLALLTATPSIAFADESVDFNAVSNEMLGAYSMYENGSTAMLSVENKCWNSLRSVDMAKAKACVSYTLAGGIIEATYARSQGRQPTPDYTGEFTVPRFTKNLKAAGFSASQIEEATDYVHGNSNLIIIGLANAGMR